MRFAVAVSYRDRLFAPPGLGFVCCIILWLVAGSLVQRADQPAQSHEDEAAGFLELTNLWTIRLTLGREDWSAMEPEEVRRPGVFRIDYPWRSGTLECDGEILTDVAVRFKGNSSFNSARGGLKRPFKLDFNRDHPGRTFRGLKRLSLNNNFNDATQFREALAYEVYRRAGLPASRTAFARVYLTLTSERTNEFLGLYTLVEAVDGDFLKRHFGTNQGLLLKPEGLPSLTYLGESWRGYTNRYDPKTDVSPADAERFISLTKLIAEADDATLERALPARLDMAGFLRYVALTAVLANYDSFVGNGHNYYFFQPPGQGKAVFIPWDLNEVFGGHPMAGTRPVQAELSVLRPQGGQNRLLERVLANPKWIEAYRRELSVALTDACEPGRLFAQAERLVQVVQETVFAESPVAKASFQRIALGQTHATSPDRQSNRPSPGLGIAGSPGFGPLPGAGRETMPLRDWIALRVQNVADELAGKRSGRIARMQNSPGAPGGPGGPPGQGPPDAIGDSLFPPELVLEQAEAIGLTAEQRRLVEHTLRQMQPRLQAGERRVREETAKLGAVLGEDRVDEPKALLQFDLAAEAERELRRTHLALLLTIKQTLTADQQAKLRELKAKFAPNREGSPRGPRPPSSDAVRIDRPLEDRPFVPR